MLSDYQGSLSPALPYMGKAFSKNSSPFYFSSLRTSCNAFLLHPLPLPIPPRFSSLPTQLCVIIKKNKTKKTKLSSPILSKNINLFELLSPYQPNTGNTFLMIICDGRERSFYRKHCPCVKRGCFYSCLYIAYSL